MRWLRYLYWAFFSQPADERVLFRLLRNRTCRSVVEIGVEDGRRAERLLRWLVAQGQAVRYTGIDYFEAGADHRLEVCLKSVYRRLSRWTPRLRLIPGDPLTALQRAANELPHTDLLIVNQALGDGPAARAWIYLPRMLDAESLVVVRSGALPAEPCVTAGVLAKPTAGELGYHRLTRDQLQRLADVIAHRTRRAA